MTRLTEYAMLHDPAVESFCRFLRTKYEARSMPRTTAEDLLAKVGDIDIVRRTIEQCRAPRLAAARKRLRTMRGKPNDD